MKSRLLILFSIAAALPAQVTFDRLLHPEKEPQNWLSYSGGFQSQRHTALKEITPANVKNLELQWVFQQRSLEKFEATPLVVDGVMYTTQAPSDVVALDAATGRVFWTFSANVAASSRTCCGRVNRGVAILGDTVFIGTIDGRLIALDAKTGKPVWKVEVAKGRGGLFAHARAAGDQRQSDHGNGGRRVRHPRFHRRLRRQDRQGSCGASTPFPRRAKRTATRGRAIPGSTAARRFGSPAPTIRI